jgi:hypothetical protein
MGEFYSWGAQLIQVNCSEHFIPIRPSCVNLVSRQGFEEKYGVCEALYCFNLRVLLLFENSLPAGYSRPRAA